MAGGELETQLPALRLSVSPAAEEALNRGASQLSMLSVLRDQLVSGAKGASLDALRASVASAVADIRAYTSDARIAVAAAQGASPQAQAVALQQASEAARSNVTSFMSDYYDRHIFDGWLTFTSAADKEEYQRGEEERRRAIDKALAEKTPEGNLRANELSIDQLKDAGAHGATRSPDYQPDMDKLESGRKALAADIAVSKQPAKQDASRAALANIPTESLPRLRNVALADPAQDGHGLAAYSPQSGGRAL